MRRNESSMVAVYVWFIKIKRQQKGSTKTKTLFDQNNLKPQTSNLEQIAISLSLRRNFKNRTMSNRTFTMIKPDAMKNGHAGAIIDKIIKAGFRIVALKQTKLTEEKAGEFYAVHKARPFYGELVDFMSSGVIIAAILEKDNAVADFRTLIGATDPAKADEGTIRKLYATSVGENAVHGSDSDENAKIEGDFFFSGLEQF
jgi:nucleoside-diphosphate kinase